MYIKYENTLKRLSCTLIAALLLVTASSSFAEGAINVEAVVGYVTVTNADGEVKRLKSGDTVENGDIITTGEESSVSIILANGKTITLGASQTYTVGKNSDDGNGAFAPRSLSTGSPTLSTATSAGGTSTTPEDGGSPTN